MAAAYDSVDLMGTDLAHPRPRPRYESPAPPPPRAIERLAPPEPASAEMEAPVWPGIEPAPPVRRLHAHPTPTLEPAPDPEPDDVVLEAPVAEFDALEEGWFEDDPFLSERPAGLPWWALAVPASAALGMTTMVLTALILLVAWA